jgi:hypothetical protein
MHMWRQAAMRLHLTILRLLACESVYFVLMECLDHRLCASACCPLYIHVSYYQRVASFRRPEEVGYTEDDNTY